MIKIGLFIFTIVFMSFELVGQTVEPSSCIVANILQLEFEILYSVEKNPPQKTTSWNIPNILIRYGLLENIELQLHTPFTKERCFVENKLTTNVFEFNEIEMGLSINLWKQNRYLPEAAVMARIVSPTEVFNFNALGNIVSFNFSNQMTKKIALNYNLGTTTSIEKRTTGFYIINISYQSNSQLRFFIENSSNFNFNRTESNCLGTGFGVNLMNNISVDFSFSQSLKNKMFYTGVILAWAINTQKES